MIKTFLLGTMLTSGLFAAEAMKSDVVTADQSKTAIAGDSQLTPEEIELIKSFSLEKEVEAKSWSFSLGMSFRQLSDVKLHAVSSGVGNYYNGSYDPGTGDIKVDDDGAQTTPTPGAPVFPAGSSFISLSSLDFQGSSEDVNGNGIVLGLSHLLSKHDNGYYSLDISLTTLFVDESFGLTGSKTDVFVGTGSNGHYHSPGGPIGGGQHPAALPGAVPGGFNLDLSAFTIGLGASQHYVWDCGLTVDFGAGPSLTIVSYDFEGASMASDGSVSSVTSSDTDFLFGVYAQANIGFNFNESWALVGGVRYDLIQEIDDDVADVDLSGLSFQIKAVYSF